MNDRTKKIGLITVGAAAAVVLLGLMLWYYDSQGMIKIFKTAEEKETLRLLTIDRSRFEAPMGVSEQDFEKRIKTLEDKRKEVLAKPDDAQLWSEFGFYLNSVNDHAGAAAAWEKSLEFGPDNLTVLVNLANVNQYFIKDLSKVEPYYLRSLEIKPDYPNTYDGLMDLYRYNDKSKIDKFEPLVLLAIKNDPENRDSYYTKLIGFFMEKEHYDLAKAGTYYGEFKKINPQLAEKLLESYPALAQ